MSDLVADSEDLLARIGRSESPQVRALSDSLRGAVEQLNEQMRARAKLLRTRPRVGDDSARNNSQVRVDGTARDRVDVRWLYVTIAASVAIGVLAWMQIVGKHSRDQAVEQF